MITKTDLPSCNIKQIRQDLSQIALLDLTKITKKTNLNKLPFLPPLGIRSRTNNHSSARVNNSGLLIEVSSHEDKHVNLLLRVLHHLTAAMELKSDFTAPAQVNRAIIGGLAITGLYQQRVISAEGY